jgi:hypothetical protein
LFALSSGYGAEFIGSARPYGINVPKKIAARNFPLRQCGLSHVRDWFAAVTFTDADSKLQSAGNACSDVTKNFKVIRETFAVVVRSLALL